MPDISTTDLLWSVIIAGFGIPVIYLLWRKMRKESRAVTDQEASREEQERKETTQRQQQVRAGTHDQQGHRLCICCNDGHSRATQHAFKLVQKEDLWDLVRRGFGAPARYTVKQLEEGELVYCAPCGEVMELEHDDKLLSYEGGLRSYKRDAGVELQRWFKGGCNDVLARRIAEHDKKVREAEPPEEKAEIIDLPTSQSPPGI